MNTMSTIDNQELLDILSESEMISEDLRKWLRQRWVDISRTKKGGGHPPCGASAGTKSRAGGKRAYPKCVPASKAASMTKKEKESATRRKRSQYKGTGAPPKKSIYVKTKVSEDSKKDACYHKVKSRYTVWPSAYGSLALSKCRKVGAANWGTKSENSQNDMNMESREKLMELIKNIIREEIMNYDIAMMNNDDTSNHNDCGCGCNGKVDDHEASMAKSDLASLAQLASEINSMIDTDDELEGWVQAKITKAADYIEAVYKYMKYDY